MWFSMNRLRAMCTATAGDGNDVNLGIAAWLCEEGSGLGGLRLRSRPRKTKKARSLMRIALKIWLPSPAVAVHIKLVTWYQFLPFPFSLPRHFVLRSESFAFPRHSVGLRPLDDCGRSSQRSIYLKIMAVRTTELVREQWTGENECMLTRKWAFLAVRFFATVHFKEVRRFLFIHSKGPSLLPVMSEKSPSDNCRLCSISF